MRKLLPLLFAICLAVCMAIPAYAEDVGMNPDQEPTPPMEEELVTASTLDELLDAINIAEGGSTITITQTITLKNISLTTEKNITLSDCEGNSGAMFRMGEGSSISGFSFAWHTSKQSVIMVVDSIESRAKIFDCTFENFGGEEATFISVFGSFFDLNRVEISTCTFRNATDNAISTRKNTDVIIDSCIISGTICNTPGGAVTNNGKMLIKNSTITDNTAASGGGVLNSGNLTIKNCKICGNTTNSKMGSDIFSVGESNLTLDFEQEDGSGYYNESTGEKIIPPIIDSTEHITLVYLTDESATEYFAPQGPKEPINPTEPVKPTEPVEPTEPDTPEDYEKPTTPMTPTDSITNTPPQPGATNPPELPQTLPWSAIWPWNGYVPPIAIPPAEEPTASPSEEKDEDIVGKPSVVLVCGDVALDCSRSVVLQGYGDGLTHEDDSLSRAQLATLIYRLLDEKSMAALTPAARSFTDVSPDAWYAPYVLALADAGIVNGVGNGRYNPESAVTLAQLLTVLTRFVEPEAYNLQNIRYEGWARQAVETAVSLGWIADDIGIVPNAVISRGMAVDLINLVLAMY